MPDTQIDLAPGRLTGYRRWKVVGDGTENDPFRMTSITARTVWPWTPEIRATCQREQIGVNYEKFREPVRHDPEDVPNAACSCGIYAAYRLPRTNHYEMAGAIEVWGPTVVGDNAFRGRHARLVGLVGPDPVWHEDLRLLKALGELYRVPVFVSRTEFCAEFPVSDVSALLPPAKPVDERVMPVNTYARGGVIYTTGQLAQAAREVLPQVDPNVYSRSPIECWCGQPDCPERRRAEGNVKRTYVTW